MVHFPTRRGLHTQLTTGAVRLAGEGEGEGSSSATILDGVFGRGSLDTPAQHQLTASAAAAIDAQLLTLKADGTLNQSQVDAVRAMLLGPRSVQLVTGPPGTGKTTVISHASKLWLSVSSTLEAKPSVGRKTAKELLVVTARSNVAVRNVAIALTKLGLRRSDFRQVTDSRRDASAGLVFCACVAACWPLARVCVRISKG